MGTPDCMTAPVDNLMDKISSVDRAKDKYTDNHMIASAIFGVDIKEVYSPERVKDVAKRYGLTPGSSLEPTDGWALFYNT